MRTKKQTLFNEDLPPACEYCEHGRLGSDFKMILCKHRGVVSPYFRCKKFRYSPIRRTPKRLPKLPDFNPSDFSIK